MGGDAVEEPAIVGDDSDAAGEFEQRIFERAQGFHVEVVGGFVEQQHVAAGDEGLRQVQASAFAAGELADDLALVRALEVEAADVGARRGFVFAHGENLVAAGDVYHYAASQSSNFNPAMRENSPVLCVTRTQSFANAMAAICKS